MPQLTPCDTMVVIPLKLVEIPLKLIKIQLKMVEIPLKMVKIQLKLGEIAIYRQILVEILLKLLKTAI